LLFVQASQSSSCMFARTVDLSITILKLFILTKDDESSVTKRHHKLFEEIVNNDV